MSRFTSERPTWSDSGRETAERDGRRPVMGAAALGLMAGIALGFAGYFGGFWAFLLVAVLGTLGLVAGLAVEGRLDLGALTRSRRRR